VEDPEDDNPTLELTADTAIEDTANAVVQSMISTIDENRRHFTQRQY